MQSEEPESLGLTECLAGSVFSGGDIFCSCQYVGLIKSYSLVPGFAVCSPLAR